MAQSREYPDLLWVPPRSFTKGRTSKGVRLIVVHHTAGAERSTSAEDGAAYDARRTDGTSTHYFIDSNSVVQCVRTTDMAHTARRRGNQIGIQYEFCGTLQTRAQWLDAASRPLIRNAARQIARDAKKYGIPVLRKLTVAETRNAYYGNGKGLCSHWDCTRAFPEDDGDHTDPGPNFPWDVLISDIKSFMGSTSPTDKGDDDMPTVDEVWSKKYAEYIDEDKDGKRELRTVADMLFSAQKNTVELKQLAAAAELRDTAILKAVNGGDSTAVVQAVNDKAAELAAQIARVPMTTVEMLASSMTPQELAQMFRENMTPEQVAVFVEALEVPNIG
jgi:hypothetical protein